MSVERDIGFDFIDPFARPELAAYLGKVRTWHGYVRFLGLPHLRDNPDLPIERLFVQPRLAERRIAADSPTEQWADETVSAMEALAKNRRLVVLGDPGSGKSTLTSWLAWRFGQGGDNAWTRRFGPLVPVPMVLRDLKLTAGIDWPGLIDAFLGHSMAAPIANDRGRQLLDDLLVSGQALVLMDGLDEVGDPATREALRFAFFEAAGHFPECRFLLTSRLIGYESAPCHHVTLAELYGGFSSELFADLAPALAGVGSALPSMGDPTSFVAGALEELQHRDDRTGAGRRVPRGKRAKGASRDRGEDGTGGQASTDLNLARLLYAAPFDDTQIEAFASNWYGAREAIPEVAASHASKLVEAVHGHGSIEHLARVPNLLTMMALIYRVYAQLPDGRALLYDRITEAYLESIDAVRGIEAPDIPLKQKRRWLGRVGFEMQCRRTGGESDDRGILVETDQVVEWIGAAMEKSNLGADVGEARTFVEHIARRSGLLIPRGEGVFAFAHLSFQEYFAAVYLAEGITAGPRARRKSPAPGTSEGDLRGYAADRLWHDTLVFVFEFLASDESWTDEIVAILFDEDFEKAEPAPDFSKWLLVLLLSDPHGAFPEAIAPP